MGAATYQKTSLTIAIPAYSEEENIEWILRDTFAKLPAYFNDYEVIVVDDGSTDRTGEICDALAKEFPRLTVIHQKNAGYSKAMLAGIRPATKEFVAYLPADGQFLVDDMRYCFEVMEANDLVLGYRGGRPDYTLRRITMSYFYLLILAILFGIKFVDVGWVNIWRTKKVQSLTIEYADGIFLLSEIVVKFMRRGHKVVEAPSFYHVRRSGEVKNAKFSVAFKTFLGALRLWVAIQRGRV